MIKVGRIEHHNKLLSFISAGQVYRFPGELFRTELLNKQVNCEVEHTAFRKVVVRVIS